VRRAQKQTAVNVMNLLAIECATNACSAALWLDDAPGPHRHAPMRRGHGEALMPMVAEIMGEAGLEFADLQAIAVTTGPGAFTGIRIGLSAARGFALAAGLPVVGVTTLEAIAAAQDGDNHPLLVALDSKREDIYVQLFASDGEPLSKPLSRLPGEIAAILPAAQTVALAGDRANMVLQVLADRDLPLLRSRGPDLPDAAVVARVAARRLAIEPLTAEAPPPAALYLRPPDAIPRAER
jgi:tRNA threonylcarbamoyladenosine biosynthesis protein TsaB